MNIIPKNTKMKTTIWKQFGIRECIFIFCAFLLVVGIIMSNIKGRFIIAIILGAISVLLIVPMGNYSFIYTDLLQWGKYLFSNKKYIGKKVDKIVPYTSISDNGLIVYPSYFGRVIAVGNKEYYLESDEEQEIDAMRLASVIKSIGIGVIMDIVKIDKPLVFDKYIDNIGAKLSALSDEPIDNVKRNILLARLGQLEYMNTQEKEYKASYYIVIYSEDKQGIDNYAEQITTFLAQAKLESELVKSPKDVAVFLKYCNTRDFDEREIENIEPKNYIDWIKPKSIKFKPTSYVIDNIEAFTVTIGDYPLTVDNAWGADIMDIDNTKVVIRIEPVEQMKAIKRVDKVVNEIVARKEYKASDVVNQETHLDSMSELLQQLSNKNETLSDVIITITGFNYEKVKFETFRKKIRNEIATKSFNVDVLFCRQVEGFVTSNITRRSALDYLSRGINSSTLGALFPFVHTSILEDEGVLIGYNNYPIIWNPWKLDHKKYVNSNIMVLGKPGSGKSYWLKTLLTNEYANNTICYIIDPENEYNVLIKNAGGRIIDVDNSSSGNLNPFHVYQILTDNGQSASSSEVFNSHLTTLESFFKIILEGIGSDVLEIINNAVVDVYKEKGITENVDVKDFAPEQFPIFEDLYKHIVEMLNKAKGVNVKANFMKAESYIRKFAQGGRYSERWNKYSSLTATSQMTCFNFQKLFANKNNTVANAQMLLVFRFLENEVINIRERNRVGAKSHIMIIADEAHMFIDPKYPIALDFFYQMAKRIRKYNGTFIPATQNVADWNANADLNKKTTAIISNTQYTFVFGLNPNDAEDLTELYRANPINTYERQGIISAEQGQAFYVGSYNERSTIHIVDNSTQESVFSDIDYLDKIAQAEEEISEEALEERVGEAVPEFENSNEI